MFMHVLFCVSFVSSFEDSPKIQKWRGQKWSLFPSFIYSFYGVVLFGNETPWTFTRMWNDSSFTGDSVWNLSNVWKPAVWVDGLGYVWDMCGICWDLGDSLEIWEYFVMPMFGVSPCQTRWKIGNQTLQVVFLCQEKLCVLFLFLLAVVLIDLKAVLTLCICESAVFTIRFWFLIGFEKLTSIIIVTTLTCHFVVAISLVLIIHNIRSNIAARQNSGSASSLMLGFRHVLRGVCDGDFLLDRSSCYILDDASCLERLLKSKKKLSESNFLDLFMDAESRLNFLNFLNAQDPSEMSTIPRIPRGLRVSLQGADGPVSLDLFHTRIPSQDSADYCFSSMKFTSMNFIILL